MLFFYGYIVVSVAADVFVVASLVIVSFVADIDDASVFAVVHVNV